MADGRQVRLAVDLLDKRGYPTELVSGAHRGLGATDDSMGCSVAEWVEGLDQRTVAALIDRLFTGGASTPDQGSAEGRRCGGTSAAAAASAAGRAAARAAAGIARRGRNEHGTTCAPHGAQGRR